jgi:plasmid stabilization system protein ParE
VAIAPALKIIVHPEADIEVRQAIEFYKEHATAAASADDFVAELKHFRVLVLENPMIGKPFRRVARQFVIKRFPYSLFYQVRPDSILIAAVAHHKRRPGYWMKRLRNGF